MSKLSKLETVVEVVLAVLKKEGFERPPRTQESPMGTVVAGDLDKLARILLAISHRLRENTPAYTFSYDYTFCENAMAYDEIDLCAAVSARTN
ncbi:hypothetical protein [Pseudoduganella chitinolytica]|uniref:Uncharacterized protein n=1 Tax=Pseudoduganella chitinolytica TaxID=34070 RepID=A0ABY8BHR5_9BURK|nr:hypothetical protein [Pseudoduganella chitinolytica]WEF34237.1 hypothetical protein PX653_05560 [Pseudoduganella chitinolytica]